MQAGMFWIQSLVELFHFMGNDLPLEWQVSVSNESHLLQAYLNIASLYTVSRNLISE